MPLTLRRGRITAIVERHEELVRLEVDGAPCVAYPRVTGAVEVDDDVLVNTQARELGLGSGGFDVLYANLTRGLELAAEEAAHVMKLPYTPAQFATVHAEETGIRSPFLHGLPVVACTVHSQVAPVCAALEGLRVAYVQLPGGALPIALSDTVRLLRAKGMLDVTVSAGACFGGDLESVGVHTALLVAAGQDIDAAVCSVGPGIVGTGTRYGHGGMSAWQALVAADELEGRAVLTVRVSESDPRERHRGVSHHAESILALAERIAVDVPWPAGCPLDPPVQQHVVVDVSRWREACSDLRLSHMGRGADDDPWFFAAAFAAGEHARALASVRVKPIQHRYEGETDTRHDPR